MSLSLAWTLFKLLVRPDTEERELAEDEEEYLFIDKKTGKASTKVVKKSASRIAADKEAKRRKEAQENRYPKFEQPTLKSLPSAGLHTQKTSISITKLHEAEEPEDCDILSACSDEREFKIHTAALFDFIRNNTCKFWCDLDERARKHLSANMWQKSWFCDDSREYFEIMVNKQKVSLFSKYFGAELYLTANDDNIMLLARGLMDSDAVPVPDILCELDTSILLRDSARFDHEEEYWEYITD